MRAHVKNKVKLPALQIALDLTDLAKAVRIASYANGLDNIIVEAGTPIIKRYGTYSIEVLKAASGTPTLADMKTMDAAELEVDIAGSAGADIITVLGVADDATLTKALNKSRKTGLDIQVDLISHPQPVERSKELKEMGVPIIGFHTGIDVQYTKSLRADSMLGLLKQARKELGDDILISVAGGIKLDEIGSFVEAGADIVVVGSAITRSSDPRRAIRYASYLINRF